MERRWIEEGDHLIDIAEVRVDDLQAVAEHCRHLREHSDAAQGEVRLLAQIPAFLVERYINDAGIDFREFMTNPQHAQRMLNDPALAAFRVAQGRV